MQPKSQISCRLFVRTAFQVAAKRRGPLSVILVSLLLLALTLQPHTAIVDAAPPAPSFSVPIASTIDHRAPSTMAPNYGSHRLSLQELRGHSVLLNFFNTQCIPCIQEQPVLVKAARRYSAKGVLIVGIATFGDTSGSVRDYAHAAGVNYPLGVDNQTVSWHFGVGGVPTSFFIDRYGRLRGQIIGPVTDNTVQNGLAQAGAFPCTTCQPVDPPPVASVQQAITGLGTDVVFPSPKSAPGFRLIDQNSQVVSLHSLRGKVILLTFISSLCTEQCPLVGQTLSDVSRKLGKKAADVAIVAISVAPEVDTVKATHNFARRAGWLGTPWYYLTAPRSTLAHVWSAYGIYVAPLSPVFKVGQTIEHQTGVYVLDQNGALRGYDDVPLTSVHILPSVLKLLFQHRISSD